MIALGGGIRAIYKIPEPARSLSDVVPSRWALESNLLNEASVRPCGYLPAAGAWDACPHDGRGVDVATAQFPQAVAGDGPDVRRRDKVEKAFVIRSDNQWPRSARCSWSCSARSSCS